MDPFPEISLPNRTRKRKFEEIEAPSEVAGDDEVRESKVRKKAVPVKAASGRRKKRVCR